MLVQSDDTTPSLQSGLQTPPDSDPELSCSRNELLTLKTETAVRTLVIEGEFQGREDDGKHHHISTSVPTPPSSSTSGTSAAIDELPHLFMMQDLVVPELQAAIITPEMGSKLNVQKKFIPVRRPELGEVVVRIAWTGMCRSDVCFSLGPEPGYPEHNHIAGHEGIGHIVQSYDLSLLGKPVAMRYLAQNCGHCYLCLRGIPENCAAQINFPKHHNGTFQQYVTASWNSMMPLPAWVFDKSSSVDPAAATTALCSGSTALKALKTADPQPNSVVVVVGIMGGIGHLVGLLAKQIYNCKVIGLDWEAKRASFPAGAHTVYDIFVPMPAAELEGAQQNFQEEIKQACYKLQSFSSMADACVVAASSGFGLESVPSYVRDGGSIVFVGQVNLTPFIPFTNQNTVADQTIRATKDGISLSIPLQSLVERQLRLQGAMMGGREEAYQMLHYIHTKQIIPMLTQISLDEVGDYMHGFLQDRNSGKTVCCVNGSLP